MPDLSESLWRDWERGTTESGWSGGHLSRGRKPDIEFYQVHRFHQHVVMVKEIQWTAEGASLRVYDSNSSWLDREVVWHRREEMFSAFDVINGMPVPDPRAFVGVFLVDQDENERVLESLVSHYRQVCQSR